MTKVDDVPAVRPALGEGATGRPHNCEECGRVFTLNEDETPYCPECVAAAEREIDEANARRHAPRLTDRQGRPNGPPRPPH